MATTPRSATKRPVEYPTSDGKPMAETDVHRKDMVDLIATLEDYFAADPKVYVSGNLLLFYEEGNKRKHVAPDVLVVRGVPKLPFRKYYLLWEEGRGPDLVIELTSKTTRKEDREKKLVLYRDPCGCPNTSSSIPSRSTSSPRFRVTAWRRGNTSRSTRRRVGCPAIVSVCTWSVAAQSCGYTTRHRALSANTAGASGRRGRGAATRG